MEYREGRCPKCNEVMQIPTGRDRIICMFCGHEFSVEEEREADHAVCESQMQLLRENAASLFQDVEKTVKGFQRTEYESSFARYCSVQKENLKTLQSILNTASDREAAEREAAEIIVSSAVDIMQAHKGRIGRESLQLTLNMYMVTFMLPAILAIDNGALRTLTDEICKKWAETFKNSKIQAAGYDTLQSGFRRKLCYITTAVCEGLHKPKDCYELNLLKAYRDEYLLASVEGEVLVAQYYDMAPTIVKRLHKRKDQEEIYRFLYETYISPCVQLIEEERNEECREKYQEMVAMLQETYM